MYLLDVVNPQIKYWHRDISSKAVNEFHDKNNHYGHIFFHVDWVELEQVIHLCIIKI